MPLKLVLEIEELIYMGQEVIKVSSPDLVGEEDSTDNELMLARLLVPIIENMINESAKKTWDSFNDNIVKNN